MPSPSIHSGLLVCREARAVRLHQLFLAGDRGVPYPRSKQSGASESIIAEGLGRIRDGRLVITSAGRALHAIGQGSSIKPTKAIAA